MSANRKLSAHEWLAVAVTVLSGFAEIYYFASYLLTEIPTIAGQSPYVPVLVWAAAVLLIGVAANRSRRATGAASPDAANYSGCLRTDYLRTIGLITYPLYLTHNVVGSAIIRVLVDAGLNDSLAVAAGLGMLVLVCWFICAKIEPAIRHLLKQFLSDFGRLPKTELSSPFPILPSGLRPLPVRARVNVTGR
jgi:peptidoglycan/LPS O-acetylase OafA/YrhL